MPHTLAHIGAQALGTRALVPRAHGLFVLAACVVPDLPWILQRLLQPLGVLDPYALLYYAVAQASLLSCWILCGALAAFARDPARAFAVLAWGSLLHLLLDATQWKFGNGVHLLAPFAWQRLHLDWYGPESWPTGVLTGLGLAAFVWFWREPPAPALRFTPSRAAIGSVFALLWLGLPALWASGPESADSQSATTLRDRDSRAGKRVDFDRNRYVREAGGHVLHTWAGEPIRLRGAPLGEAGVASVQGRFLDAETVQVLRAREHTPGLRDGAAAVGLLAIGVFGLRELRRFPRGDKGDS